MNTVEVSAAIPDTKRPELKNLHQIFKDEIGKDGSTTNPQLDLNIGFLDLLVMCFNFLTQGLKN